LGWLTHDLPALLASYRADAERNGGVGTMSTNVGVNTAVVQVFMHEPAEAALTLQTIKPDATDKRTAAIVSLAKGYLAVEQGNPGLALLHMEAFWGLATPAVTSEWIGSFCPVALVEEAAGRPEKADEVFRTAVKSLDCLRFRGDVLNARGRWDEAQKAYEEAVAYAPDLPAGYYSWGVALLRHNDFAPALDKLKAAHKRGPHWADPLKAMGDAFAVQGRKKEAISAYDQALKLAPAWVELRRLREHAGKLQAVVGKPGIGQGR
jgi:tetratricopeptide (TPR) repeat protein